MHDQQLIDLLEMRKITLSKLYDNEHLGRKRAEVLIRINELYFLIQYIKNLVKEERKK